MTKEAGGRTKNRSEGKAGNVFWNCLLILKESIWVHFCKKDEEQILFVKGAPDVLLDRCTSVINPSFLGKAKKASRSKDGFMGTDFFISDRNRILQNDAYSQKGMRILALACRRP